MKLPELDKRTKKDILEKIKKTSLAYTPEWRYDQDNPEAGTALSIIYANMMSDTINRFNRVPELNRTTFFQRIGADMLPAIPAKGYATFGLVNQEVPGVEVRRGTRLSADDKEQGTVIFETVNDVYVTPASLDHIYVADGAEDRMVHLYDREAFEVNPSPFYIFDAEGENLQSHEMYFCHDAVLRIESEAWIVVSFQLGRGGEIPFQVQKALLDQEKVRIEYFSGEGYTEFYEKRIENDELWLRKQRNQPGSQPTRLGDRESYVIRMTVKDVKPFLHFSMENITVRSHGSKIMPELIHANGIDQKLQEFYPFGERPSLFTEVYFVSREVLCKKGAMVSLSFQLEFVKVPLEFQTEEVPVKWKYIMKRSDFKPDVEFDITVEEVSWEYFNGEGWSRLYLNNQHADMFSCRDGKLGTTITMTFQCPQNISPFQINSINSYSIRARVLKMNNLFKMKGNYITPLITKPSFRYDYMQKGLTPTELLLRNNMAEKNYSHKALEGGLKEIEPFYGLEEEQLTMYLGFTVPPLDGPIKLLFSMLETINGKLPRLVYEYYGGGHWQALNIVDETDKMRKTGVITMTGSHDFMRQTLFGRELYWIRILDGENAYRARKQKTRVPCISGIYINSTKIEAVETMEAETFQVEVRKENQVFQLLGGQVYRAALWVNERKTLSDREMAALEEQYKVRYGYDADGQIKEIWVCWNEVENFALSGPEDRHYILDRIHGSIRFSDGRNGRIPSSGPDDTILVEYSCGGGLKGNVDPGQVDTIDRSIGFINRVTNHEITTGGSDQETLQEALLRNAAAMKHGYRAVMPSDYEALALEASRNILRGKCIANCNGTGEKEYGAVTLVLLQKDYIGGRKFFDSIKTQVVNYITPRMSSNLVELNKFHVIEPRFIEISVHAEAVVKEFDQVFEAKGRILEKICRFIDPTKGNFNGQGWEIGTLPNNTQVLNAIQDIKELQYIRNVRITGFVRGAAGLMEVDLEREDVKRFVLPIAGTHEIIVGVE
ncbi:MAG TPA: hypothetical protein GXX75_21615 [Clostridiales bacterium]|nr:hypothetical protein [Clostridiales bacterium]